VTGIGDGLAPHRSVHVKGIVLACLERIGVGVKLNLRRAASHFSP